MPAPPVRCLSTFAAPNDDLDQRPSTIRGRFFWAGWGYK
jgi:hypothetical protein